MRVTSSQMLDWIAAFVTGIESHEVAEGSLISITAESGDEEIWTITHPGATDGEALRKCVVEGTTKWAV